MASISKPDELRTVFGAVRSYFVTAGIFSLGINLLFLAAPLYMLQVYDRVISSGSVPTLVMLTLAVLGAFLAIAGLDMARSKILSRAGIRLDALLAARVVSATLNQEFTDATRSQPLRDFDTFRQFITGNAVHALFDLPWTPIYIGVIFMLHPALGLFALAGVALLLLMALINEWLVRGASAEANEAASGVYSFTEMSLRNSEVIRAMGMTRGLLKRWSRQRNHMLERQLVASDRAATMSSLIRFSRLSMQSLILGLGAFLAIQRLASIGAMFAASILLGRALQPVEQVVGQWRALLAARGAYGRIKRLLATNPRADNSLVLPRPAGRLAAQALSYVAPGSQRPLLRGISFQVEAGEVLGVIGPSGAGKSTLARLLVGVLKPSTGAVRLDGADLSIWPREQLGRYVGYLPQDIELFADSVASNISRFLPDVDAEIVEAARLAGVHDIILQLPNGYDTQLGEAGTILSGGHRQRAALARAVFGRPSLVILDEPNSSLDTAGDFALAQCIAMLKEQGTTVVIISHRAATLAAVDKILVLRDGVMEGFGDRQEIVSRFMSPPPLRAVPQTLPPASVGSGA